MDNRIMLARAMDRAAFLRVGDLLPTTHINYTVSGVQERETHRDTQHYMATHTGLPVRTLGQIAADMNLPLYEQDTVDVHTLSRMRAVLAGVSNGQSYVTWPSGSGRSGSPVSPEAVAEAIAWVDAAWGANEPAKECAA